MTITYCDLCGIALPPTETSIRVAISEYKCDSCDSCARKLIAFVKGTAWKPAKKLEPVKEPWKAGGLFSGISFRYR